MAAAVAEETLKLKVRPLTAEAFRPYGAILEPGTMVYPEAEEGRVALEILRTRRRPTNRHTQQLAIHFTYNQTFIPVQGSMVLIVAPAPEDREADIYAFDFENAAAFLIEPGQGAFIEKGVWHNVVPVGLECTFVNVTRKNADEDQTEMNDEGRVDTISATRTYVGFIDLVERYQRTLELEL